MKPLSIDETKEYVDEHIVDFHRERLKLLAGLNLRDLLTTNPYLFPAKNVRMNAGEIVVSSLNAFFSSLEEKLFGDFLEGLAVFVAQKTCDGHKSAAQGVDLEFINNGIHYVVSIK